MQKFKQQYLILSADTYAMEDEKTGVINKGISIWYIPDNDLSPSTDESASSRGQSSMGIRPVKASFPLDLVHKIKIVPAIYDVTLKMVSVMQKQQIKPVDLEYVSSVKLVMEESKWGL